MTNNEDSDLLLHVSPSPSILRGRGKCGDNFTISSLSRKALTFLSKAKKGGGGGTITSPLKIGTGGNDITVECWNDDPTKGLLYF